MRACILVFVLLFSIAGYSQNTINGYKYVLVPEKFDFLKESDQYQLNSRTKQLLVDKGFVAFVSNEKLPSTMTGNRCNALLVELTQRKALFTTNLTLTLKDCQGNIIYKGKEGKSREKEFDLAYNEALKEAFVSLNATPYRYDSTLSAQPQQVAEAPVVAAPVTSPAPAPAPVKPAPVEISGTLYAQATPNGYQLIDLTPKKVLNLLKTSMQDYYIAEAEGSNGVVFKKDNEWIFERYENNKLVTRKLDIKF